ncbi:hypothetical protein PG985_007950 [Apiospora marii]|uniref:Ecp2 effector protein-like domain-containing protein n=1 Tax=Apiospora marii TaxID=335849 RepID=A0ABR1R918_9PEZI
MQYLAFIVSILASAWLAAGVVVYGNFTPTESPVSVVPHVEPALAGTTSWKATDDFQRYCAAPIIDWMSPDDPDITKADCNVLIDYFLTNNGYWTLQAWNSCVNDEECAVLAIHRTCGLCAARPDGGIRNQFFIGNRDAALWVNKARDAYADRNNMNLTYGGDQCKSSPAGFTESCWKVYYPPLHLDGDQQ